MRASCLALLGLGFLMAGCGGTGGSLGSASTNLAGVYVGTWTDSAGGASQGASTVSINSLGNANIELDFTASGVTPERITGTVDGQGNFTGQVATMAQP